MRWKVGERVRLGIWPWGCELDDFEIEYGVVIAIKNGEVEVKFEDGDIDYFCRKGRGIDHRNLVISHLRYHDPVSDRGEAFRLLEEAAEHRTKAAEFPLILKQGLRSFYIYKAKFALEKSHWHRSFDQMFWFGL